VPPEEVLHNITVSRAFTAYQMSTLIEDMLDPEVDRIRTGLVVVSCFPDLFQDADMNWTESLQLMRRAMEKLRALTEERSLITIITNYGQAKPMSRKGLRSLLYDSADRVVRIDGKGVSVRITLPKEGEGMLYRPVARNQTTLDEFRA
jgi:RecA/RadA recombinase